MTPVRSSFHSDSERFVTFNNTSVFCLVSSNSAAGFNATSVQGSSFTKHCCWHRNCQLSTSILHDILEFSMFRTNEVNTTQSSGIVKLRWSTFAFLFASTLLTYLSKFLATESLVWMSFAFLSVSHQTSNIVNLVKPVHISDNSRSPVTFHFSTMFFSSITSNDVLVALVTSMYSSGTENGASLGTYNLTLCTKNHF